MAVGIRAETLKIVTDDGELIADADQLDGLWTKEQYFRLTDNTNWLIEFTDGKIEVLPMPTDKHQAISQFLLLLLHALMKQIGGVVRYSPLRLQLNEQRYREPDLMLLLDRRDPRKQNKQWLGADLVVEIVSTDNPERDTIVKRADYAQVGIPEYWIVNPLNETFTVLQLQGDEYAEHGVFRRGEAATSPLLADFSIEVGELFDAD